MKWQLQHAKAKFSEMINRAIEEGPQTITRHGKDVAVLVPAHEYERLRATRNFKEFLASAPFGDLKIRRSRQRARKIEL
jgi:antitoxin Phd